MSTHCRLDALPPVGALPPCRRMPADPQRNGNWALLVRFVAFR